MEERGQPELLIHQAENATSFWGILAGLTFTTSVLIFSFRASLSWGDIFLALTLITTILFIYAASVSYDASRHVAVGDPQSANVRLGRGEWLGFTGFITMLVDVSFIAFSVGLQYGALVIIVVVLGFIYISAQRGPRIHDANRPNNSLV